jgi:hypothetical protein
MPDGDDLKGCSRRPAWQAEADSKKALVSARRLRREPSSKKQRSLSALLSYLSAHSMHSLVGLPSRSKPMRKSRMIEPRWTACPSRARDLPSTTYDALKRPTGCMAQHRCAGKLVLRILLRDEEAAVGMCGGACLSAVMAAQRLRNLLHGRRPLRLRLPFPVNCESLSAYAATDRRAVVAALAQNLHAESLFSASHFRHTWNASAARTNRTYPGPGKATGLSGYRHIPLMC